MAAADGTAESGTTLRDYLNVARRRKWIILQAVVLVPAAAIGFSLTQTKLYEASADVLLRQSLANSLTGASDGALSVDPIRVAQTQAELARAPQLAARVLDRTGIRGTDGTALLAMSSVAPRADSDLLTFTVRNRNPALAARLATTYASSYVTFKTEFDTESIQRARRELRAKQDALEAEGRQQSSLYSAIADKDQQLATLQALQTANAVVVRPAGGAALIQPKTTRNALLGVALGLVLGLGLAFLWEALDTRVRTADDIASRLGLPVLARIPEPPKSLRKAARLAMLAQPASAHAEAFRMLRTNLDFARLGRQVRTIMFTSSVEEEGKSTTIANLAITLARSGERVILVDLDLRRPYLDKFFDLLGVPGVTQVALGTATLEEALAPIAISGAGRRRGSIVGPFDTLRSSKRDRIGAEAGSLSVLVSGQIPPAPGEFVATQRLEAVLEELREDSDIVLIDAPPALRVGDAMTLSARVDAIIVVTRINVVRRHMLQELKRMLDTTRALKLGFVLTGADDEEGYAYGYANYEYRPTKQAERLTELA